MTILTSMIAATLALASCKKEDNGSGTKAVFSYITDGFVVNFTDFSRNAAEYSWDFGDQATSTDANPSHIYGKKGDYLVSLTVKNGQETSTFVDTVFIIGPNIKIDDNFSDWEHVEYSYTNPEGKGGTLLAMKTFASAAAVNFYLEGSQDMNLAIIDLYIDADNNPETGFKTWMYPVASGADFLCEGTYNSANPSLSEGAVYAHTGANNGWGWDSKFTFAEVFKFSKIKTLENGRKAIEISLKRDALGPSGKFMNYCFLEMDGGWSMIGHLPVSQEATSKFAPFEL